MKVFLSWSGVLSHRVALVIRDWLPSVIQTIEPYVSSEDIDKGARWSTDIAKELENSTFGILCVTKENINAPWLNFEAGALSKTMDKSFVSPFLFDIVRSDVNGPILQFQSTILEKEDIKKLLKSINKACDDYKLTDDRLEKAFEVWYPKLEEELNQLKSIPQTPEPQSQINDKKNEKALLEEILELTRINQKILRNPDTNILENLNEMKNILGAITRKIEFDSSFMENRKDRRIKPMMVDELIHSLNSSEKKNFIGVQIALSFLKEDFPWIYDSGIEVLNVLKNNRKSQEDKHLAIKDFMYILDFSFEHPLMREVFRNNKENKMYYHDISRLLSRKFEELLF